MSFVKKNLFWILGAGIILLYFVTRYYNILSLPIFTDEAIYVRWSQIAKQDANWRFISLTDGKQPSFVWLAMSFMRFIHDPLLASRSVSVFAGFFSMLGLFFLTKELFKNKWIGLLASFLYVIYPFAMVYDRMALYDSLVGMFVIWGLYCTVLFVRHLRLDMAFVLGLVIGGGMLTKTNAFGTLILQPVALLLFDWSRKQRKQRFIRWVLLTAVVVVLANAIYAILRLSPFFYIIAQKNAIFFYPVKEWLHHPFEFVLSNLSALWDWFVTYMTVPFLLLILISFIINKKFFFEKLILVIWFIAPFVYLAFFGKTIYPRFILFMTLPLLPLVAYSLVEMQKIITNKIAYVIFFALFLLMPIRASYLVLTNFGHAPIPKADIGQLYAGWPSGVGVNETVKFLKEQAKDKKIYVATQGTFGLMPYALEIYLIENQNIKIQSFWPIGDNPPKEVMEASKKMPTYFVFYQPCVPCKGIGQAPALWPMKQIFQIQKQQTDSYFTLYQVESR